MASGFCSLTERTSFVASDEVESILVFDDLLSVLTIFLARVFCILLFVSFLLLVPIESAVFILERLLLSSDCDLFNFLVSCTRLFFSLSIDSNFLFSFLLLLLPLILLSISCDSCLF